VRSACRSEPGHRFAQRFDQFGSCGPARRGHPVGACWLLHYDGGDIGAEPPTSASRPAPPLGQGPWSSDEPKVRAGVALASQRIASRALACCGPWLRFDRTRHRCPPACSPSVCVPKFVPCRRGWRCVSIFLSNHAKKSHPSREASARLSWCGPGLTVRAASVSGGLHRYVVLSKERTRGSRRCGAQRAGQFGKLCFGFRPRL
jgi:hypothetical protein